MRLPKLRPDQLTIALHPAKVKVLSCGRRWGKTVEGGTISGTVLAKHGRVAWVVPTYKNSRPLWRWLLDATAEDVKAGRMRVSRSERTIETKAGGFLGLYSGDNIDSIRGEWFHLVVVDEAARVAEDAWSDAIMPTLADRNGDAILISTPKGKNWFWQEFVRAQSGEPGYAWWQLPTSGNPMLGIQAAFAKVRDRVPEITYRQEWLAEFVDAGLVFRKVRAAAAAEWQDYRQEGHQYCIGVDWGRKEDFTVLVVMDVTLGHAVHIDRFNQIDWTVQLDRVQALYERFRPYQLVVEENSQGDVLVELMQRDGLPVYPFLTGGKSKQDLIESLMAAFERDRIKIPRLNDPNGLILINELNSIEMNQLSQVRSYSAPSGMHDDCMMALALAWSGAKDGEQTMTVTRRGSFHGQAGTR